MDDKIFMIPTESLFHHPKNPRLNLGDLTEPSESIKARGIMRNPTVIKTPEDEGKYWVVIGNPRIALAFAMGGVPHDNPEKGWCDQSDGKYDPNHYANEINEIYNLLIEMGYQLSDFELDLKNGSHECYQEEE